MEIAYNECFVSAYVTILFERLLRPTWKIKYGVICFKGRSQ